MHNKLTSFYYKNIIKVFFNILFNIKDLELTWKGKTVLKILTYFNFFSTLGSYIYYAKYFTFITFHSLGPLLKVAGALSIILNSLLAAYDVY